jgi:lipopolysaccharide transport system ATP-binding protein
MSFEPAHPLPALEAAARGVVVDVRSVSKCFNIYDRPQDRLLQAVWRGRRTYFREFWPLRDVSLQIREGEIVGVIGRNGSGKSTLLQLICGILEPTAGIIQANGRVSALLELGAGFNPDYTGRENVYVSGAILGLEKAEIDARFSEIAAFADIGEFMDRPVKIYSTGMFVRLAFAVAASVNPRILVVDEALAVGDAKFQAKCFRHFDELTARGTTIILVTHALDLVTRFCTRAILLASGRMCMDGAPRDVVNTYLNDLFGVPRVASSQPRVAQPAATSACRDRGFEQRPGYSADEFRWGSREAEIVDFALTTDGASPTAALVSGEEMRLSFRVHFHRQVELPIYGVTIKTPDGTTIFGTNTRDGGEVPMFRPAGEGRDVEAHFRICQLLGPGDYLISVGVSEQRGGEVVPLDRRYDAIHVQVENPRSRAFGLAVFDTDVAINDLPLRA